MDTKEDDTTTIHFLLNNITAVVKTGNIEKFKNLITKMHDISDKALLRSCFNKANINLISLLCEYKKKTLLKYLLHQSHILHYFTNDSEENDDEIKFKEDVFYKAICSDVFEILEMLYDYWSGDLHWVGHKKEYNNLDVKNVNQLGKSLLNAFKRYESDIELKQKADQSMVFNVQALIAFNHFQKVLYTKLNDLRNEIITWPDEPEDIVRIQETYAIRKMIAVIIDIYETHQKQVQNYNIYSDTNSLISKAFFYFSHEVYFRKLDFNICLLILDNLHLLKLRLSMHWHSYQQLEKTLYQFVYHVTSKWRLYWPKKKKMKSKKVLKKYNNVSCSFTIKYDANKWESYYYIIFLERRNFEKNIIQFRNDLLNTNVEENIKKAGSKPANEDVNSLILLPELRDHYSLTQMSQHIAQLYSIDLKNDKAYGFLIIERTLQVVGEFLKSSNESLHLEDSTEALLKAEISVNSINDLKSLRNMLCHAKKGKLLKRIDLEINKSNIFEKIRNELLCMKSKLDIVINVHRPFIEMSLIQNSLSIMCDRRNEIPEILGDVVLYVVDQLELLLRDPVRFFSKILSRLKLVIEEAAALLMVYLCVLPKLTKIKASIRKNVISRFPVYINAITHSLNKIRKHMSDWNCAINTVKMMRPDISVSNYPNESDTNKIISFIKESGISDNSLDKFSQYTLFVEIRNHWSFILQLLKFIVFDARIFESDRIKESKMFLELVKLHSYDYNLSDRDLFVNSYLDMIKDELNISQNGIVASQLPHFTGIKDLKNNLKMANFLTTDEKEYLIKVLQMNVGKDGNMTRGNQKIKIKIENDVPIPMKDYQNFVQSVASDKKAEEILLNLVLGKRRHAKLHLCLKMRISLLKEVAMNQSESQLIVRYKLDKTFRVILEVLLFDIFDILENNKIVNKSSRLLTEINLRNTFTHGSPLLEVVDGILDSNDLPTELVTKALKFIEDEKAITALCTLIDSGFNFVEINNNNLTQQQKALVDTFKTSERWEDYLQLIPNYKKILYEQRKLNKNILKMPSHHKHVDLTKFNCMFFPDNFYLFMLPNDFDKLTVFFSVLDDTLSELVRAVYSNDAALVRESISKGADINLIDSHNKAALHHAALLGYVDVMKVLLNNNADVNIKNVENNMTALHYSAMHGYKEAVELLVNNGADCLALDGKGRSPLYLANQRKHTDISRILLKAMKRTRY